MATSPSRGGAICKFSPPLSVLHPKVLEILDCDLPEQVRCNVFVQACRPKYPDSQAFLSTSQRNMFLGRSFPVIVQRTRGRQLFSLLFEHLGSALELLWKVACVRGRQTLSWLVCRALEALHQKGGFEGGPMRSGGGGHSRCRLKEALIFIM